MSWFSHGVDELLERSIVGSFTRIGSAVRRRLFEWTPPDPDALVGKVVVITGATSGLGRAAAERFVRMGAHLEFIARDDEKARRTREQLRGLAPRATVEYGLADMGDLQAVRRVAEDLRQRNPEIHVLIHNAGALDDEYATNPDGLEQTVASQVVGPFVLTHALTPALRAGAPARVVWVSSGGMYSEPLAVDKLVMPADGYDGVTAYARAKRAQVSLAALWAEKLADDGILVHSMHPGWADTPGVSRALPTFHRLTGPLLRTAAEGADTLVWMAAAPEVAEAPGGSFWLDRQPRAVHRLARTRRAETPEERRRLWHWVATRAGLEEVTVGAPHPRQPAP